VVKLFYLHVPAVFAVVHPCSTSNGRCFAVSLFNVDNWRTRSVCRSKSPIPITADVIDGNVFNLRTYYDTRASVLSETYPDGLSVSYAPDAFGRPTSVGSYASGVQYYPNGTPMNYTLGNGLTVSTSLNSRQVPATMQVLQGSTPLQSVTYGYSNELDVMQITDNVDGSDSAALAYDDLHRLTSATGLWGGYIYGYDTNNNITSRTGGAGTLTYNYVDGTNRLNSITGITRNYGYDTRGRVTSDGLRSYTWNDADEITVIPSVATYGYDAMGKRIRAINASTGAIEYALYDASGRLVFTQKSGVHTDYLDLAGKPLAEVANYSSGGCGCGTNGQAQAQTQGFTPASAPGGGSPGTITYLHPDLLGSPKMATSSTGQMLWREHYDPYGVKLNGVAEKIGYTSHAFDQETGLTYAQARFYDAAVGRFISKDSIGFTNNPFSFNRYSYGNDNPYKFSDPTGMEEESSSAGSSDGGGDSAPATGTHLSNTKNVNGHVVYGGNPQKASPGHDTGSSKLGQRMAATGQYKEIRYNQNQSTVSGDSNAGRQRADVSGITHDNKIDNVEVISPSQNKSQQDAKGQEMQSKLSPEQRGVARSYTIAEANSDDVPLPRGGGGGATAAGLAGVGLGLGLYDALSAQQANPNMSSVEFMSRLAGVYPIAVEIGLVPPPPPVY